MGIVYKVYWSSLSKVSISSACLSQGLCVGAAGVLQLNSEGSVAVCVPDRGAQGAAATAFSAAAPPIAISAGPSRASLIGLAVGLAVAGAALLAAVLLAAAFFALRARDYPAGSGKRALLDPATPVRTSKF